MFNICVGRYTISPASITYQKIHLCLHFQSMSLNANSYPSPSYLQCKTHSGHEFTGTPAHPPSIDPHVLPKVVVLSLQLEEGSVMNIPMAILYVFHLFLFLPSLYFSSHDYSFTSVILTQHILLLVTQGRPSLISSIVILCIPYTLPTCSLPYCPQVFAFCCNLSYSLRL
jgi:hypothetical protein